jgi:hypothetical protein
MRITRSAAVAAVFAYAAVSVLSAATPPQGQGPPPLGSRVVATLQLGPITVAPGESTPFTTAGSWTQAPGDLNFLYGQLTATGPASCHNQSGEALEGFFFEATARVDEGTLPDSVFAAVRVFPFAPLASTLTRNMSHSLNDFNPLFGPSAPTLHTVEFMVTNLCANAGESVTIDSIEIKVVAVP